MTAPAPAPRSELLADVIEVDSIYRDQITRLSFIIFTLLAIVMVLSLAVFALVVRNQLFILPQGMPKRTAPEAVERTKVLYQPRWLNGFLAEGNFGALVGSDGCSQSGSNHRARNFSFSAAPGAISREVYA